MKQTSATTTAPLTRQARAVQRTTLNDIARELGVSVSMVSKVLNRRFKGRSSASRAKAQAIFDKARELNYIRNTTAASLVKGRQDAMGIFVHEHGVGGSEITSRTVRSISTEAGRLHQRLMLHYYATPDELLQLLPMAHHANVDGLVMVGVPLDRSSDALLELAGRGLPVTTVYDHELHPDFPNIGIDQTRVAALATRHLVERGCRRIGFVGTQGGLMPRRVQGYCDVLREAGLEADSRLLYPHGDFTAASGEAAVNAWRAEGISFDGIVGQSDQHAAGAINALLRAGVAVPEQVKVIGIDDSPFCDFYIVPISSVSQQMAHRGQLAVQALYRLTHQEPAPGATIEPTLATRASTGG